MSKEDFDHISPGLLPDPEAQPRYRDPLPIQTGPEAERVTHIGRPSWCAGAMFTDDSGHRTRKRCDNRPADIRRTYSTGSGSVTVTYDAAAGVCDNCARIEAREQSNSAALREIRRQRGTRRDDT